MPAQYAHHALLLAALIVTGTSATTMVKRAKPDSPATPPGARGGYTSQTRDKVASVSFRLVLITVLGRDL